MQERKITLITIIVLMCIFLPLAAFTTTMHYMENKELYENKEHEFYLDGKLYFYKENDLLGTYVCQNTDYCDYAVSRNTSTYELLEPKVSGIQKQTLIQNHYAILMDTTTTELLTSNVILYDVVNNQVVEEYKELKNYGVGLENNYYIAQNQEGLWGVLKITDQVEEIIPFMYDYIGVRDSINESGQVEAKTFAVLDKNNWYLINEKNEKVTDSLSNTLIDYNEQYLITSSENGMDLLTYDGRNRLFGTYQYLHFCGPFIALVDANSIFYVYDIETNQEVSNRYTVSDTNQIVYEKEKNTIHIYVGDELLENIAIS